MRNPTPVVLCLLCLPSLAARAQETPADTGLVERTAAHAYTVRLRFEPRRELDLEACRDVGPADLEIRLYGDEVSDPRRIELDREPEATVHGLLIDTSGSMLGHLDYVRQAAAEYVRRFRPDYDTGMVMSFDETAVLWQGVTGERTSLLRAIESVRMGGMTSLLDALDAAIREVDAQHGRPVVLLLTDGVDSASVNERDDIRALVRTSPDLSVFVIGLQLPPISANGPPGLATARRFLQRLAQGTNGAYFEAPTPSRLGSVYQAIRTLLDNEATLTVIGPEPESERGGGLKIRSRRRGCKVRVFESRADAARDEEGRIPYPYPDLPGRVPLPPGPQWSQNLNAAHHAVDPACGPITPGIVKDVARLLESYWRAEVGPGGFRACALDVVMETGMLYDPMTVSRWSANGWVKLRTRPLSVDVPPLGRLPRRIEEVMDSLAEHALAVASVDIPIDSRKRPAKHHARPFEDYPRLLNGHALHELRPGLARSLFLYPEYRDWALERLDEEVKRDLELLERRFRLRFPELPDETLRAAVLQSRRGLEILARSRRPTHRDLQRHLAAWLGDLPAHDLFVAWEALWIDRRLAGEEPEDFPGAWAQLRRVFFVPSYARSLTLLFPVHDAGRDAIGFHRVILPRVSWLLPRVKGHERHPEWTDLPLDLVPDRPMAFETLDRILEASPDLVPHLDGRRYRTRSLRYELLGRPYRQDPRRGFRRTRVVLRLGQAEGSGKLDVEADLAFERGEIPRIERCRLTPAGDALLERLAADAAGPCNG